MLQIDDESSQCAGNGFRCVGARCGYGLFCVLSKLYRALQYGSDFLLECQQFGQFLDDRGITVRTGHHCAQPLHRRLGVAATARASAYVYTTSDDITRFRDALSGIREFFGADR